MPFLGNSSRTCPLVKPPYYLIVWGCRDERREERKEPRRSRSRDRKAPATETQVCPTCMQKACELQPLGQFPLGAQALRIIVSSAESESSEAVAFLLKSSRWSAGLSSHAAARAGGRGSGVAQGQGPPQQERAQEPQSRACGFGRPLSALPQVGPHPHRPQRGPPASSAEVADRPAPPLHGL